MSKHRTTDPACRHYLGHYHPDPLLARYLAWRLRRGRGKPCPACMSVSSVSR